MKYKKGLKYQVVEDYQIQTAIKGFDIKLDFVELDPDGILLIRNGYASDGPSKVPFDTLSFIRGAFIHDAFYQLLRSGILPQRYRKYIDNLLGEICIEDEMNKTIAWIVVKLVRLFGAYAAKPKNKRKIYTTFGDF